MQTIDLNADLGEGELCDAELLKIVSSCNIACGGHAGDAASMHATVVEALRQDVAIGAHPSYPDREGFGRRARYTGGDDLYESLTNQVSQLADIASELGAALCHLKPHGALYNDAAHDPVLADLLARVTDETHGDLALAGPPGSALQAAAEAHSIGFIAEAFVDRAYENDGSLTPRSIPGAVHTDASTIAAQAVLLALQHRVETREGKTLQIAADTLCIHGDTNNAVQAALAVRAALEERGVRIAPACKGRNRGG